MVKVWIKNVAGMSSNEQELMEIKFPRLELTTHVTVKVVQTFGLLGLTAVGPLAALAKGNRDFDSIRDSALMYGQYGAMTGLVFGPVMVGGRMATLSKDQVTDRCYRLRHNMNVARVDRISAIGSIVGSGLAAYNGKNKADGAIVGMAGGILLACMYNIAISGKIIPDTSGM